MNTAEQLIRDVQSAISGMGDELDAVGDFIGLICVLLTVPEIEEECPGLHRLVMVIREHHRAIRERHMKASTAVHRLANP
jgi:hypothetical protein